MEIVTFRPKTFEGHQVFVRRIGTYFEYIVVIGGQLYSHNQVVRPKLLSRILKVLRIKKDFYTRDEIIYIQKYLETLAVGTVQEVTRGRAA